MRGLMTISRAVSALTLAMLIWSCNSGTNSTEAPPGGSPSGGSGGEVSGSAEPAAPPEADAKKEEPRYVTVQHVLIGFKGSVGQKVTRTKEEAQELAEDVLKRAKAGEDFDALVVEYTDDSAPGIYKMSNHGVPAPPGGRARGRMVAAFGDVGFPLEVGGIGMAAHHPTKSPFGWHIIKRTE